MNNTVYAGKTDSDSSIIGAPGLFQRSGNWNGSFNYQGSSGHYSSSTQGSAISAYYLYFISNSVNPASWGTGSKSYTSTVRCVAE